MNLFYSKTEEFKFANITIHGRLDLYNIINIKFEDVNVEGSFYFDKDLNYISKNYGSKVYYEYLKYIYDISITMSKVIYKGLGYYNSYCISLRGNVIINDSQFYGGTSCEMNIINYFGDNYYNMDVSNMYCNGMYINKCFYMENVPSVTIYSSTFENGASINSSG